MSSKDLDDAIARDLGVPLLGDRLRFAAALRRLAADGPSPPAE